MAPRRRHRVNITLDAEHAAKLFRVAERTKLQVGTLAGSLLSRALDEADLEPSRAAELLDGIPGAYERALFGREEALAAETIPLDDV
jgi:hypothetical protein